MTKLTLVNGDEQRVAEDLDALLTARLAGQDVPLSADVPPQEAALAGDLVELAEAMRPDPAFLSDLGARLERTPPRQYPHARWSLLQNLNLRRRPAIIKRTAVTLVGAAVLALLVFLALPLIAPQPDLPSLPSLAALSAYAQGGGTSGSGVFPGTTFVLNTTLPAAPARVTVYRRSESSVVTLDEFRRLAERFGLRRQIYTPDSSGQTLAGFTLFDGSRQLSMMGDMVTYGDRALQKTLDAAPPLAFPQAAEHARAFLQTHGLLDLPYRVESSPYAPNRVVRFVRLLNGAPLQYGEIEVVVASDGQIAAVSFRPLALERVGDYPIRSAQAVWEQLVSGKFSDRIQYSIRREESSRSSSSRRFWYPEYRPGQRVDVYGSMMVYRTADGKGSPVLRLDDYELRGKTPGLDQAGRSVHIWGTPAADGRSLDVAGWELDPTPLFSRNVGTIHREGKLVLLRRADGKTFVLPNAPDDLPDGIDVDVGGRETNRTESNYPVLDWTSVMSPPNALPSFSQRDGGTSFQGNVVVAPVQTVTPSAVNPNTTPAGGPIPVPPPPPGQGGPVSGGGYAPPVQLPTPPLASGQRIEGLEGWLQASILESADGKTRTLNATLAQMPLSTNPGWAAKLTGPGSEGIGQYDRLRVRVWGRFSIQDGESTIAVERYEKAIPDEDIQGWLGKEENTTVQGRQVTVFHTREGQQYILASSFRPSPPPPMTGQQVLLEGVLRPEITGGYRIIEQISLRSDSTIAQMTELTNYQPEPRPKVIRQRQPMPGKAYIESIEMIYYAISNPLMGFSYKPMPDQAMRIVQPLWKFSGHTQDGASFEILVQAVADPYVKR